MTNPTDTNQAREDELQARIDQLYIDTGRSKDSPRIMPHDFDRHIKSIIRTEKLKLLAEVRERVVGEDVECDGTCDDGVCGAEQRLIDFQRQQITKLEEEL